MTIPADAVDAAEAAVLGPLPRRRADAWSLVLASEAIDHRLVAGADGVYLSVAAADADRASASLAAFLHENGPAGFEPRAAPAPRAAVAIGPDIAVGLGLSAALLLGYAATGDASQGGGLAPFGAANSGLILRGELWRTVTALTLHAGLGHVIANAMASLAFVPFASTRFGGGLTALAVVVAGALGNALNAALRGPGSSGVGFSTALFGAVGLLAGARLVDGGAGGRAGGGWLALGAALALLALLGAGAQTDVLAHACGLACGVPLGAALARAWPRRADAGPRSAAGAAWQWSALAAAAALVAGAWRIALG